MSEQVNEPTEREKELTAELKKNVVTYDGYTACFTEQVSKALHDYAAEVRAAERARWEAAAEKLIADIKEEFPRDSAEWVDESMRDVWLAIGDSLDALAALLTVKDNATEEEGE